MPSKGRLLSKLLVDSQGDISASNLGNAVVTDGSITTAKIADDAVTGDKIVDNVEFQGTHVKLPSGGAASRPGSPVVGMLRYNSDTGVTEQYAAAGWQAIDSPPIVSGFSGTINENTNSTITVSGSNFKQGSYVVIEGAAVSDVSRQLSTTFIDNNTLNANTNAATSNYIATGAFDVKVVNPTGLSGIIENAGLVDSDPVWVTSAGSLGTVYQGVASNISVSASDPDGDNITYTIDATPTGMSTSGGSITGTPSGYASAYSGFPFNAADSATTIPFTATATANGQTISRSFSVAAVDPYNPLNIITNYWLSSDIATHAAGQGTVYPNALFDDECDGGGLVHGQDSNAESNNWIVIRFAMPVRINSCRVKGRNHSAQYLGSWKWYRDNTSGNDSISSYNGLSGWSTVISASSYEPGTCTMGSWINASSNQGYSYRWMFTTFNNNRGAYQSLAGLEIDYDIQV
jgi:hypothetical protein